MEVEQVGRSWWLDHCDVADPPVLPAEALEGAIADVVVVGLGASGLEAIAVLAARGVDVIGLDAQGIAAGAAGANGGFLLAGLADFHHDAVARHGREVAVAWWWHTVAELDRLAAAEPTFRRIGSLRIAAAPGEADDIAAQLTAMCADGIDAEAYDGPEGVGLLVPADGAVHPVARCRRLAAAALAAGARLVAPALVTAVGRAPDADPANGPSPTSTRTVEVRSAGHQVLCGAVVVAVDGRLEQIGLPGPPPTSPVRTARLQMLATVADPGVSLPRPVYCRHGYDYVQQLPTGEVLLGGGRDVGGEDEWARGELARGADGAPAPSPAVQSHLDRWAAELGVTAPVARRWAAHAAFADDRLPQVITPSPGVTAVGGYSGHGNVLGGLLAREAAERAVDGLTAR